MNRSTIEFFCGHIHFEIFTFLILGQQKEKFLNIYLKGPLASG